MMLLNSSFKNCVSKITILIIKTEFSFIRDLRNIFTIQEGNKATGVTLFFLQSSYKFIKQIEIKSLRGYSISLGIASINNEINLNSQLVIIFYHYIIIFFSLW